ARKWGAMTGMAAAKANRPGRIGTEGWPPSVLLQSSKSSAWEAVPFTSAASVTDRRCAEPNIRAGPVAVHTRSMIWAHGSADPASVTPTVSRLPVFAHSNPGSGRPSYVQARLPRARAERRVLPPVL